jgi:hypothetical protein
MLKIFAESDGLLPPVLAFTSPTLAQELAMAAAAVVTLWGAWLCWTAPRHRMSVEEHAKDGHLTEDDARRRLRVRAWLGPALVIAGVLVLAWVVLI